MNAKVTELYVARISRFRERLAKRILPEYVKLKAAYGHTVEPLPFDQRKTLKYKNAEEGLTWGAKWESAWFHVMGQVPEAWAGKQVVAQLDVGGEGLVFDVDGTILQGLSNGSVFQHDFNRDLLPLFEVCEGGEQVELWIEGASNGLFGLFTEPDPEVDHPNRMGHYNAQIKSLRLAVFDATVWHLWLDLRILEGFLKRLDPKRVRHARLLHCAMKGIDLYGDAPENAAAFRDHLKAELGKEAAPSDPKVTAVGHAHIDTAWLWPVRETVRKCARTFANQLSLMERYPEFVFGASQPQHFVFVKEHYPQLYERMKVAVAEGRLEPQGGMWVEADCNIISGESMVRQILHGKNFFRDEFGIDVNHLWLPDVFGYSAAMPQILRQAGMEYFLTQKWSWSQFNEFPHTSFRWRGIDGSEVLTHFPPENTYNSQLDTEYILPAVENFKERGFMDHFISLYGVGDGGGGPKAENIELGRRMANLEGAPRVQFGRAVDFFKVLKSYEKDLPLWVGELYLELHRGTLTSQAKVKRENRRLENRLQSLEILASHGGVADYPIEEFDAIWKGVMLNQFHDIIPGSSINPVYEVTHKEYEEAHRRCDAITEILGTRLLETAGNCLTLVNTTDRIWRGAVTLPVWWEGEVAPVLGSHFSKVQKEGGRLVCVCEIEAHSMVTLEMMETEEVVVSTEEEPFVLQNDLVRYVFSQEGALVSAWDFEMERELVVEGEVGNQLTLYRDHPNNWDAWDVDLFYEGEVEDVIRCVSARSEVDGPARGRLIFEYEMGDSTLRQTVSLMNNTKRLDFKNHVDWRERHRMLRVSFPVVVDTTEASFDIQYGYVTRPTHRNTSWDLARFEVCGHRYADLSNQSFGVALLNDCKYGYKVHGNVLDLNLLRSPNYPDPKADLGEHEFTYSLLPHVDTLIHSPVMREAMALNYEPIIYEGMRPKGGEAKVTFPWKLQGSGLSMTTVKRAEKSDDLIVRVVETRGRHVEGFLHSKENAEIRQVDLLEWEEGTLVPFGAFKMKPFEIATFRLRTKLEYDTPK